MQFGLIGVNYKKAQLDIRDKTSFTDGMKLDFFQRAEKQGVEQCMVLSTCNRSEVYFFYEEEGQAVKMRDAYMGMFPEVDLRDYLFELRGEEAIAYLFRLSAGLESLVLGEDQILGQVKEALDYARTMGYSKKEMNRVVRNAVTCAKRVKTELKISEKPLSVSYVGIKRLEADCGIAGKRILVIGSGHTAMLALKYLFEYKEVHVTACSRNHTHTKKLRETFPEIEVASFERRYEVMESCDIVVSATASPHLVVRREEFTPVRPVTFLDLAAPRDVDIALAKERLVNLINLDSLLRIVEENRRERERLVTESRRLIEEDLEETRAWLLRSRMDSTIESLQARCGRIVEDSYAYLNRKMELSPREQKLLKKVLNASLQRLLREPIQELKQIDSQQKQEEYKRLVEELFRI